MARIIYILCNDWALPKMKRHECKHLLKCIVICSVTVILWCVTLWWFCIITNNSIFCRFVRPCILYGPTSVRNLIFSCSQIKVNSRWPLILIFIFKLLGGQYNIFDEVFVMHLCCLWCHQGGKVWFPREETGDTLTKGFTGPWLKRALLQNSHYWCRGHCTFGT